MGRSIGSFLQVIAALLLLLWFAGVFYALLTFAPVTAGSTFMWWYATIALANNFTVAIFVAVPVLLALLPFGLLAEWLEKKGNAIQERAESEARSKREATEMADQPPPPPPLSGAELAALEAESRASVERTAAHLADYFGPDGPKPPTPYRAPKRRRLGTRHR
jgi:hypothetical protein